MDGHKTPTLEERLLATEEALRQAEQRSLAGQLALELMHEIRNSVEALGNLVYLTREHATHSDLVREYMDWADEQTDLLSGLPNHTLGMAKPSPSPQLIDLGFWRKPPCAFIRRRSRIRTSAS